MYINHSSSLRIQQAPARGMQVGLPHQLRCSWPRCMTSEFSSEIASPIFDVTCPTPGAVEPELLDMNPRCIPKTRFWTQFWMLKVSLLIGHTHTHFQILFPSSGWHSEFWENHCGEGIWMHMAQFREGVNFTYFWRYAKMHRQFQGSLKMKLVYHT